MLSALSGTGNSALGGPVAILNSGPGSGASGIGGLQMSSGSVGVLRPSGVVGLAGIGGGIGGSVVAGSSGTVKGPMGNAGVNLVSEQGGVANAGAVVAGMSAGFRRCCNRSLAQAPTLKGTVLVAVSINKNGEVTAATPTGGQGLGAAVQSCIVARVQSAQFAPPDKGTGTLKLKIKLDSI